MPPTALTEGLAVGASTLSYGSLTLFESLDAIRRGGSLIAEIHLGQRLRTNDVEATVGEGQTEEQLADLRGRLTVTGMRLVARVRLPQSSAITRLFEWAERVPIQARGNRRGPVRPRGANDPALTSGSPCRPTGSARRGRWTDPAVLQTL
jgi:hypothetical protein